MIIVKHVNKLNTACLAFDVILSGAFGGTELGPLLYTLSLDHLMLKYLTGNHNSDVVVSKDNMHKLFWFSSGFN